jgi:hypothetical protein
LEIYTAQSSAARITTHRFQPVERRQNLIRGQDRVLKNAMQVERDQEADCARIGAAISLAEAALAGLTSSDEVHKRRCQFRDGTILSVADVRRNIVHRAKQAKETRSGLIEAFFHDRVPGQSNIEYASMLHDIPTSALIHHLRYLIQSGELDRVEGVYHAFKNRVGWLTRQTQNSRTCGFVTSVRRLETELLTKRWPTHNRTPHQAMLRVLMLTRAIFLIREDGVVSEHGQLSASDQRHLCLKGFGNF